MSCLWEGSLVKVRPLLVHTELGADVFIDAADVNHIIRLLLILSILLIAIEICRVP